MQGSGNSGPTLWKRIEQEIAKCDVRCANCHRVKTAERRVGRTQADIVDIRIAREARRAAERKEALPYEQVCLELERETEATR